MAKNEKTSKSVASKAAKILRDPKSTKAEKSVAASALTQAPDRKKKRQLKSPSVCKNRRGFSVLNMKHTENGSFNREKKQNHTEAV